MRNKLILLILITLIFEYSYSQDNSSSNFRVFPIQLGSSVNAYTQIGKSRTKISVNQESGVVLFVHRGDPAIAGSSGNVILYDYSTDHGNSWLINQGPIISGSIDSTGARYPQGCIYNPSGNTNISNVRLIATAAYPNANNNNWGGIRAGSSNINAINKRETTLTKINGSIPEALVERIPGEYYMINDTDANGNINLYKGVYSVAGDSIAWTSTILAHARSMFEIHNDSSRYNDFSIAFSSDGQIGWIAVNADLAPSRDNYTQPVFWKTIDGGITWSNPITVNLNLLPEIQTVYGNSKVSADTESSMIVDAYGNPHFVFIIGKSQQNSYELISNNYICLYDITISNNTWVAKFIYQMQSHKGILPGTTLIQKNSPTINKSLNGEIIFYMWTDTKPENQVVLHDNGYPDLYLIAYNYNAQNFGPILNVTEKSSIESVAFLPSISNVISETPYKYIFHAVVTEFTGDENQRVLFKYLGGFEIFKQLPGGFNSNNLDFQISKNYPNPLSNKTSIDIELKKSSEVKLTVSNLLGQLISSDVTYLSTGQHTLNINAEGLTAGIYIYTVNVDGYEVSDKMIVHKSSH